MQMQFGGPDGELAASMRYLSQRYSTKNKKVAGVLTDIGISLSKMHILKYTQSAQADIFLLIYPTKYKYNIVIKARFGLRGIHFRTPLNKMWLLFI